MKRTNSLRNKIWFYLTIFSIAILSFLWFFQIVFLSTYYEISKKSEINKIAKQIEKNYNADDFENIIDEITLKNNVCIEIVKNYLPNYSVNYYDRGCSGINSKLESLNIKKDFIDTNKTEKNYFIKNKNNTTKVFVKALKLDDGYYIFISSPLDPVSSTTHILASQLIYVTIIVLAVSFIIGYFISKRISKPIIKINETAKEMGKGNYDVVYQTGDTIREIEELASTLNNTKDELAKTDTLRRELMANVSHDLKTPLTMIKAYAEMVRDLTYDNKEKREANLNIIIDETDRLTLLVNDILELSKMQSHVAKLNYELFDLNELIKTIIKRFSYLEETKDYKFIYDYNKKITIKADKKKMEQVLYNLIANAINYVGEDKVVKVEIENNKDKYVVKIIDYGEIIKENDLKYIWDKYYKVDKQYKRGNTGLGLSIVKNILELHNYEYGVTSSDKGTIFYFDIKKK